MKLKLTIGRKLLISCLTFGLLPMLAVGLVTWHASGELASSMAGEYQAIAQDMSDKIDRNLFERYGDVQAFGFNRVIDAKDHWYKPSDNNPIVATMNQYVDAYDVYYLTLLVDLDGKLIAVNTKDHNGKPIKTEKLYEQNYSQEKWFQDAKAGKFLSSADGSFTGTVVEDMHVDKRVQEIYNDEGFALGFSAPVKNAEGQVIAYWKNVAKFSLVEEIVYSYYPAMKARGLGTAEFNLLNNQGVVLVDCDPSESGLERVERDLRVIGRVNLAERGLEVARRAIAGESGNEPYIPHISTSSENGPKQTAGYAHSQGALGFPGLKWSVVARVSASEALASVQQLQQAVVTVGVVGAALIALLAALLASSITKPIRATVERLKDMAQGEGDLTKRLTVTTKDEMADLAYWFNTFIGRIQSVVSQIAANASTLAHSSQDMSLTADRLNSDATQSKTQSATVSSAAEEMSINMKNMASSTTQMSSSMKTVATAVEEMTATITEIARSAEQSATVAAEAAELAGVGNDKISNLGNAASEIGRVIEVIQDIAEQTNLLALNATIEAARAGEAGKGFAVVATEVKELARQTAAATDDIRSRIEAIQQTSADAVDSIRAIGEVIRKVNDVSRTIASSVEEQSITTKEIASNVAQTAQVAESVSHSVNETASASQEITRSIGRVDQVLNSTAENATQSKLAGEELARLAAEMQSVVGQFKVEDPAQLAV